MVHGKNNLFCAKSLLLPRDSRGARCKAEVVTPLPVDAVNFCVELAFRSNYNRELFQRCRKVDSVVAASYLKVAPELEK